MLKKTKLFGGALAGIVALSVWGCGDDTTFTWGGRYGGELVSFVNDSLAVLQNSRGWERCTEVFMGSDDCEVGGDHPGLFLVNYRKKEAPLWGDTVNGALNILSGTLGDSTVFSMMRREDSVFGR
ncbi:MAG: hypothetical protein M0P13_12420 [Fibrobacteraceae bacterium]|nr:hypothetical protein [Fibrobacteraceae bacterium]